MEKEVLNRIFKDYLNGHSLRQDIKHHSEQFIKGFLLGLTLSDGYIKERFIFVSTSKKLTNDCINSLKLFQFKPSVYTQIRKNTRESNQYRVVLNKNQTNKYKRFLNEILESTGSKEDIKGIKGYN